MRLLVTGGRDYADKETVWRVLDMLKPTKVVHGGAGGQDAKGDTIGADMLADLWAATRGVPVFVYFAEWEKHGRAAGPIRNQEMIDAARPSLVVAFPGGRGTEDCVQRALKAGLLVMRVEARLRGASVYAPSASREPAS